MGKKSKSTMISKPQPGERGTKLSLASGEDSKGAVLLADLRSLINAARQRVATVASSAQAMLYWHVGRRLLQENLRGGRAAYGKRILATMSQELQGEVGEGFS